MSDYLMLVAPSANRVYAGQAPDLAAAELSVTTGVRAPGRTEVAGVDYVGFSAAGLDAVDIARQSSGLALFERTGELLRPVRLPQVRVMDDDLLTITKYAGKTNEMFTRLLLHVTCSQVRTRTSGHQQLPGGGDQLDVLDPMAGRGTTLQAAWEAGHNGFGVEADEKAVEQLAAFMKTYLRRKRLRHTANSAHVRREGRVIGQRFDVTASPGVTTAGHQGVEGAPDVTMSVFTGDTRDSARLFGRRRFDAIVTDAPYGVVHGARQPQRRRTGRGRGQAGARGTHQTSPLSRSPAALLTEAVPVWAGQLRPGGALGLAWNTFGLDRAELAGICAGAGLEVCAGPGWDRFGHRVDSSIRRDVLVARRPVD